MDGIAPAKGISMLCDQSSRRVVDFWLSTLAIWVLQGCAINPLVRWDPPPKPVGAEPMVLDRGRGFSDAARQAYQQKLDAQVAVSTQLSSGLIGLGAVVAALAAGKVHRDAILGATLVGATAFTLGTWNLDRRRLLVYNGAIAALNCADRAVTPLDTSEAELRSLETSLAGLAQATAEARVETAATELEVDRWVAGHAGTAQYAAPFNSAIAASQKAITAAVATQTSGEELRYQASHVSDRLIDAVRKIDQEANAALLDTVGDLNKVPTVIASLAGIAGSIAPSSNIEAAFSDALKNAVVVPTKKGDEQSLSAVSVPPPSLLAARARMASSVRKLFGAAALVLGKVKPLAEATNVNALADCGIGAINFAMSTAPAKVNATVNTASVYPVTITGGKPPYSVKPNGARLAGVTISGPDRLASSFEVNVTDNVASAQTATYLIVDSSDPNRSLEFSVEIMGGVTPAAPKKQNTVNSGKQSARKKIQPPLNEPPVTVPPTSSALAAMREAKPFELSGIQISYPSPPRQNVDGTFTVTLACKPKPSTCLKQGEIRKAYLSNVQGTVSSVGDKLQFVNFPPGHCVCIP